MIYGRLVMKKIIEWIRLWLFGLWVQFGRKMFGWHHIGIYAPNEDETVAITFSTSKDYVEKVSEIEL